MEAGYLADWFKTCHCGNRHKIDDELLKKEFTCIYVNFSNVIYIYN